ncbi:MAG: alpha/beta hydrolase [Deltaproteobacteria bacterium]|nr:alpha/beta hydrolase [Deltaproteobacteria bacterium]MDQ3297612.1 alpha/beta hydrolase [Myxococcota bacterium]
MEQRFVNANGLRFATLEAGSGPLVLLLHGFPDTAHTWDRAIAAFAAAGFRAVAPFMRGYHPTEIPPGGAYDTDTLAQDVVALIEAQTEEPAIVIGHDWGASAAYGAATIAPGRVRLLVTFAIPHPRSIKPTPRLAWAVRHFVTLRGRGAARRVARDDFAVVDELWQRWSVGWQVPPSETAHVKAAFRAAGSLDAALGYYRALTLRTPDCHRGPVTVPTIAFAGEQDLISPRAFEKARHVFTASYEVVQVPGGHFMHRQHADHVIPELVRVVTDHARVR